MKKNLTFLLAAVLLCSCSHISENLPAPLGMPENENWVYNQTLSDEFEGDSLDTTKWYDHNPTWMGREPSLFLPGNVRVENGKLILSGKREDIKDAPEGYHTFTSAAVQSTQKVLYGWFEIKFRPMNSALSSAFWLYTQDEVKQEEVDIFEICGRNDYDSTYAHTYFATSHYILKEQEVQISDHVSHHTAHPLVDQEWVAGLKWTRDELVWYLNGEVIRRRANDFWHSPETINFDSEAFPNWWNLPTDSDHGGEFQIEYFRYWNQPGTQTELTIFPNDMLP